jgi:ribonuclease T2
MMNPIYRLLLLLFILTYTLFARYEAYPLQNCPAYNNLKHTKNTHNVILDREKAYTILREHKGQYLILVKGENPAQRWVDKGCFGTERMEEKVYDLSKERGKAKSEDTILALSWHNAYCETHRYKKECKRSLFALGKGKYREKHFVLHGLWPQPRSRIYCDVDRELLQMDKHGQWQYLPCLVMDEALERRLEKVMPGYASDLHKHEWIKHGSCYGTDAAEYFEDAVRLTEQLNNSKVGSFFTRQIGKHVTLQQVRSIFDRTFGQGAGKRVELRCERGMITELWLHLGSGSDDLGVLLQRGKQTRSKCQGGIIDRAGYQR